MLFRRNFKSLLKLFLIVCSCLFIALRLYVVLTDSSSVETDRGLAPLAPQPLLSALLHPTENSSIKETAAAKLGRDGDLGRALHLIGTRHLGGTGANGSKIRGVVGVINGNKTGIVVGDSLSKLGRRTDISDVFISVKTTAQFHRNRVDLLLKTWFTLAEDQIYFFTDLDDAEISRRTKGHLINTNCSAIHSREGLCCKMSVEYEHFIKSAAKYRWFCHVDDDNYVNVPSLVQLLQQYYHVEDWYIGKPSLNHPLEIPNPDNRHERLSFWFATGGAGFCISQGLALKMMPFTVNGRLQATCGKIRLPDDCTIAFILNVYLSVELTAVHQFHSHLESLRKLKSSILMNQITLSYSVRSTPKNIINISGFNETEDPTRFLSVHCFLFPNSTRKCP